MNLSLLIQFQLLISSSRTRPTVPNHLLSPLQDLRLQLHNCLNTPLYLNLSLYVHLQRPMTKRKKRKRRKRKLFKLNWVSSCIVQIVDLVKLQTSSRSSLRVIWSVGIVDWYWVIGLSILGVNVSINYRRMIGREKLFK